MRRRLIAAAFAAAALAAPVAGAERKGHALDTFWLAPDYAQFHVASVALLPVATYDGNLEARRLSENAVGQALRGSGHRWVSAAVSRDYLQGAGGDSLVRSLNDQLTRTPRLDSLAAPGLSRLVHAQALLTVLVEQFEQRKLEFNEAGTPTTTVRLTAALVDSSGRLLWTARGGDTLEGPYQDPNANPMGVSSSGLNNLPVTGQGGPPSYQEVLAKVLARWAPQFPHTPAAAQ